MVRRGAWLTATKKNFDKLTEGKESIPVRIKLKGAGGGGDVNAILSFPKDDVRQMGGGFLLVEGTSAETPMSRYNKILDYCIEQIGHEGPTSREELTEFMKRELGKRYLGTFAAGETPQFSKRQPFSIINTKNAPGEHWIACVNDTIAQPLFYDSYGRAIFMQQDNGKLNAVSTNLTPEQREDEDNCGQRCCAWLLYYRRYGRVSAKHI